MVGYTITETRTWSPFKLLTQKNNWKFTTTGARRIRCISPSTDNLHHQRSVFAFSWISLQPEPIFHSILFCNEAMAPQISLEMRGVIVVLERGLTQNGFFILFCMPARYAIGSFSGFATEHPWRVRQLRIPNLWELPSIHISLSWRLEL